MTAVGARTFSSSAEEDAARYQALFERSLDAIYISDESGRIVRVNPPFLRLFGYSREELAAISAPDLYVDSDDRQRFQSEIRRTGAVQEFETKLRRRDGEVRTCLITANSRQRADGTVEYQGIIRDVSERRRERAELARTTEALYRSNEELEQFAYVASHDLQEPLRKIRAFGDRLAQNASGNLDEQGQDYLRRMVAAAARMQALIDNLLMYSRVSSRDAAFDTVDLNDVVEDVLSDLEPQVAETSADVRVGDLPRLEADPLQMRQLFQNLISNALKYRKPDSARAVVEIDSEYVDGIGAPAQAGARGQGLKARIVVTDRGIGFEPEHADRIFELFQRLHPRGRYKGTGIGLGICRRIAHRHGGSIQAEGRPGEGASFEVVLPLYQDTGP